LLHELKSYNLELLDRQRLIVINKSDLLDAEMQEALKKQAGKTPYVFVSALEQTGLLEIRYESLDELSANENVWSTRHAALIGANPATRRDAARPHRLAPSRVPGRRRIERTYSFVPRVGIEHVRAVVVQDSEGIGARLDEAMQASIDAYVDPWLEAVKPVHPAQFARVLE
jgi:hypothetical protein